MMNIAEVYGVALLGGVILNVMPCVLPVLTMKVFHVVEQAKESPTVNRRHGIAYSLGILLFFAGIATLVVVARAAGESLLWGQQFQNPIFVGGLTALIFAFGLNALGVFEITIGMSVEGGGGYKGSFLNGLVAAVMATPCSAPGLGLALPFALNPTTPAAHTFGVFFAIGLGLALPFLLISYIPRLAKSLPRPGAWMETFKHLMGFTLMAAAIWLYSTLHALVSASGAIWYLGFLLVLTIGLWAVGRFAGLEHSEARRRTVQGLALAAVAVSAVYMLDLSPRQKEARAATHAPDSAEIALAPVVKNGKINWVDYDGKVLEAALKQGRPVFVDFTADWCANCKTNDKLFIEVPQIREELKKTKILPMKADFTNEDEEIEAMIKKLGRSGIPIYVVFTPDGKHHLLPEVITSTMLSDALSRASRSYPPEKFVLPPKAAPAKAELGALDKPHQADSLALSAAD